MYFPSVVKPRAILFDLGDTLINFSATNPLPYFKIGCRYAYDFMDAHGIRLPAFRHYLFRCRMASFRSFMNAELCRREINLMATMSALHRRLGLPNEESFLLRLAECFYEPMKILGKVEEDLHRVLDLLVARAHPMGLVSNTMVPGKLLDRHLQEADLLRYFPVRIYSCEVGVKKPNPRVFRAALQALNVKPQGTLFVGDKVHLDIKGAKRLGMTTVLKVRKGAAPRSRYKPDHVIGHLTELPALIDALGAHYETQVNGALDDVMEETMANAGT